MTDRPATADPGSAQAAPIPARLEPDAIGVAQDTIIGLANDGPALSVALTLAGLAAAAAYGSVPVILLCMLPMVIIANSYRRLNLWSANAGASFEGALGATRQPVAAPGNAPSVRRFDSPPGAP